MTSSSNMSGEKIVIDEVAFAWKDNGKKMFNVHFTRADGSKWMIRQFARDELDAFNIATKYLSEQEQADD